MAEMLPRLFSEIRARKRPIRLEAFDGFSSPVSGLRGSMPANALDTQAANDVAQGIDIGSIAPTRLNAGTIQAAYEPDAGELAEPQDEPQAEPQSPFRPAVLTTAVEEDDVAGGTPATPVQYPVEGQGRTCIPGVGCFPTEQVQGNPFIQSQALPPGVSVGPGETFVQGSLREGPPSSAMATTGMAAAQPGMVASAPKFDLNNPQTFFEYATQSLAEAKAHAAARNPYQAQMMAEQARTAMLNGMTAAILIRREALQKTTTRLIEAQMNQRDRFQEQNIGVKNRELALKEKEVRANTGELQEEIENGIRAERNLSAQARAMRIVDDRIASVAAATKGLVNISGDRPTMIDQEIAVITAMDLSYFMGNVVATTQSIRDARAANKPEDALRRSLAIQNAEVMTRLRERYGSIEDPAMRKTQMRAELIHPYISAFQGSMKGASKDEVTAAALEAVNTHINILDASLGTDYDPYEAVFAAPPQAQQPAQAAGSTAPGIATSGSGMGPMSLQSPSGTMSLAR